jgi:fumarate reductase flavoprotein subunit
MIVGEFIADYCDAEANAPTVSPTLVKEAYRHQARLLEQLTASRGGESPYLLLKQMQQVMTDKVGIFRDGDRLVEAVSDLQRLLERSRDLGLRSQVRGANPELVAAYRLQKMLKLALCVSSGALARTESRGAHYRRDYPRRDDANWLCRTLARWPEAGASMPELTYEPLDVTRMELPPGWRGYGARDHLEHPDAESRLAEVERIRQQHQDPVARQQALLSFESLLPMRFRGANARLERPGHD